MVKRQETGGIMYWSSKQGKRTLVMACHVLFLLVGGIAYAEAPSAKEPIIEHLEFLGYECDRVEAGIRAKHVSKIHLYVTYSFGGIRVQTGFPGKPTHSDVKSRYQVTNALGKQLSVMQVYWSEEGNLFAMAWMPGRYEKARFAVFLEVWDHDVALLRQIYDQLTPFLQEQRQVPAKGS